MTHDSMFWMLNVFTNVFYIPESSQIFDVKSSSYDSWFIAALRPWPLN